MRAFIAVDLPEEIWMRLGAIARELRRNDIRASWVKPDNLHVTLKFLGEIDDHQLEPVKHCLDFIGSRINSFDATLTGFDFFPPRGQPRILYVAADRHDEFQHLVSGLDDELVAEGFEREKAFTPHITLARIKGRRNLPVLRQTLGAQSVNGRFTVSALSLYRSHLHPSGVRYELLYRTDLLNY